MARCVYTLCAALHHPFCAKCSHKYLSELLIPPAEHALAPLLRLARPPCRGQRAWKWRASSQVHALGDAALLLVQSLLLRLAHVHLCDLHAPLSEGQHTGLGAHGLDVGAAELVLGNDEFLQVDVVRERHLARVDLEDPSLGLLVRQWELDLPVDTPGTDHGRVQRIDAVGGHDDLDFAAVVETVELIQQFKHRTLNLLLTTARGVVPLGCHSIDFVDENDRRRGFLRKAEHLADQFRPITQVLLDELTADDTEEGRGGLVGHGLGQERLAGARHAVEDHALRRLDAHVLVKFGVRQRKLDGLLDFLNLVLEATDVGIRLQRCLVHLHDADQGVDLVGQDADHAEALVVQQHRGTRLELILVHEGKDVDIVLRAHGRGNDAVVLVDELLQGAHIHRRASQIIQFILLL
mmetsp:Transcript_22528/g.72949  ORF Transcript_22528/g.72949 Transcript_22528/m.72949 type:complete len:408 (-) Transcript_22528:387-1610(-)